MIWLAGVLTRRDTKPARQQDFSLAVGKGRGMELIALLIAIWDLVLRGVEIASSDEVFRTDLEVVLTKIENLGIDVPGFQPAPTAQAESAEPSGYQPTSDLTNTSEIVRYPGRLVTNPDGSVSLDEREG